MCKPIFWMSALLAAVSYPALADQWSKSFKAGAKPELHVTTNDGNVTVRASAVNTIEARVLTAGWKIGPGDVRIAESQTGDRVELEVKVPSLHFNLGDRWVKIELDVPTATTADIHTGDGNIRSNGLRQSLQLLSSRPERSSDRGEPGPDAAILCPPVAAGE